MEGNHQSEIEDLPEVVQREDSQSRVVSEQTDQVNESQEQEPEVSFSTDDSQNPGHPDKGQPPKPAGPKRCIIKGHNTNKEWTNIQTCALFWNLT